MSSAETRTGGFSVHQKTVHDWWMVSEGVVEQSFGLAGIYEWQLSV